MVNSHSLKAEAAHKLFVRVIVRFGNRVCKW
jgi:hypothetical protein